MRVKSAPVAGPMIAMVLFVMIALAACGPSAEEKRIAEQKKMDSVAEVIEAATRQRIETRIAFQDSLRQAQFEKERTEALLSMTKADLAVAEDRLRSIKGFHFLRTASEREDQIRSQTMAIDEIEMEIKNEKEAIRKISQKIKYFEAEIKNYQ